MICSYLIEGSQVMWEWSLPKPVRESGIVAERSHTSGVQMLNIEHTPPRFHSLKWKHILLWRSFFGRQCVIFKVLQIKIFKRVPPPDQPSSYAPFLTHSFQQLVILVIQKVTIANQSWAVSTPMECKCWETMVTKYTAFTWKQILLMISKPVMWVLYRKS